MSISKRKSKKSDLLIIDKPNSNVKIQQCSKLNYLPDNPLHLWQTWDKEESPRSIVPSHTPNSEYDFEQTAPSFPKDFPALDKLEIPFIRNKGVKYCIDVLGDFFGCRDYKFNLLQFWFLDVLTDCLWMVQDDFNLPVLEQKIVLSWVLYLINLIRDPTKNISRGKFFTIFKEAMLIAAEVVDEGCDTVPTPEQLFSLVNEEEEPTSWMSSENQSERSSLEINTTDFDNVSCIELNVNDEKRRYVLPQEICNCSKYDLSSVDSVHESGSLRQESKDQTTEDEAQKEEMLKNDEFYQPDLSIPARFLPLPKESEESQLEIEDRSEKPMCKIEKNEEDDSTQEQQHVDEVADEFQINRTSEISETTKNTNDTTESTTEQIEQNTQNENKKSLILSSLNKERLEKYNKKQVLKGLAFQKLWEQRLQDMESPRKGWVPTLEEMETGVRNDTNIEAAEEEEISEDNEESDDDDEWADILLGVKQKEIMKDEDKLIINFGVLRAVINFVFRYFYESFQFTLIKMAFQATPDVIFQKLNHEWKIPKKLKGELQKPKVEKKPKEKPAKKETPKKAAPKKEKEDKKKGKEDKKKDVKKEDKQKGKKDEKKGKPVPLTKEEKAELERQQKEQERIEEELRKIEEQKRFMYPLTEAATDELFKDIFEDWVKIDLTKAGKDNKGIKKKKK